MFQETAAEEEQRPNATCLLMLYLHSWLLSCETVLVGKVRNYGAMCDDYTNDLFYWQWNSDEIFFYDIQLMKDGN